MPRTPTSIKKVTHVCDVEKSVKQQFAKVFKPADWHLFKDVAEYYLRQAAFLRKRDVNAASKLKLLVRNSQKRLFIGVGIELLLKALYLKNGYAINKPERENKTLKMPFKLDEATASQLVEAETFSLDKLIDQIERVLHLNNRVSVVRGLKIAKVFRNKEGHSVTALHAFDASNYVDIETSLRELYLVGFHETLTVRFSLASNEQPRWRIRPAFQNIGNISGRIATFPNKNELF